VHQSARESAAEGKGVVQSGVIRTEIAPDASCADLIRASIVFVKSFCEEGWIAGSSPAMTVLSTARPFTRHARPCAGHPRLAYFSR
jgi:hypothetical protein